VGVVSAHDRFGPAYYRRFYGAGGVHSRRRIAHLVDGVLGLARWWQIPIRSVLDVGAGPAFWRDAIAAHRPRISYHGLDVSEYACRRYGHERADLATWRPRRSYDLVVCQSVIQYLDNAAAAHAIGSLALACRGLLFFEAPTTGDRVTVVDHSASDVDVHWRTAQWYRRHLAAGFTEVGASLWVSHSCPTPFFELERARVTRN
jgi:trans-aconitate methyltransferase